MVLPDVKRAFEASGAAAALPFGIATAIAALTSVASVIIFTRLLAGEGYGLYASILALAVILQNAAYLPLQVSITRLYARTEMNGAEYVLATTIRVAFLVCSATVAAIWMLAMEWLAPAGINASLVLAGAVLLILRGALAIVQAWHRASGRPWTFLLTETVQAFGSLILAALALTFYSNDPAAVILAGAAATAIAAFLAPGPFLMPIRFANLRGSLLELFTFGGPLALVFLASASLALSDRLLIALYVGAAAAGSYAVAFAAADRMMALFLLPLTVSAKPVLFTAWDRAGTEAARPVLLRTGAWLVALGLPLATILIVIPEPIAGVLAGGGLAQDAAQLMPWLGVGALLSSLLMWHFALAFQLTGRTIRMVPVVAIPASVNILANLVLLPRYGVIAAGWTTVGSYVLALALAILIGRRETPVPFPFRMAAMVLIACAPFAGVLHLLGRQM